MCIPKIIHYCWFGKAPKPPLAQRCFSSWKKYCPDYEIREWNEDNFDLSDVPPYVRQAYEAGRWAFVTDYVRLWALTKVGGVYLDTDVELVKPLDPFLRHEAFAGFESPTHVQTAVLGCQPGFPLFREFLEHYDHAQFQKADGTQDTTTNVEVFTNLCMAHGLTANGLFQLVDGLAVYPCVFFCPIDYQTGKMKKTRKTTAIHWFSGSWHTEEELREMEAERIRQRKEKASGFRYALGKAVFGDTGYERLKNLLRRKR